MRDLRLFVVNDLVNPANKSDILSENIAGLPYWPVLCHLPFKDKAVSIMAKLYDINMKEVSPMNATKILSGKPVFFIHGKNDSLIPSSNSEAIFKSFTSNPYAKLWLAENVGHMESLDMYKTEYLEAIKAFLDNSMSNK